MENLSEDETVHMRPEDTADLMVYCPSIKCLEEMDEDRKCMECGEVVDDYENLPLFHHVEVDREWTCRGVVTYLDQKSNGYYEQPSHYCHDCGLEVG